MWGSAGFEGVPGVRECAGHVVPHCRASVIFQRSQRKRQVFANALFVYLCVCMYSTCVHMWHRVVCLCVCVCLCALDLQVLTDMSSL